ncbi:MAG TPA: hypothetical protein VKY19_04015 [Ktedonosporobacter sp.]|jgi:hypothetical protein|nr:hypothetical protein [Ktedonosporobacter sp.]
MAQTLQIGHSTIVLTDHNDDFHDGYSNGYLYYYDERHRPPFPLTSDTITTFIQTNMTDPHKSHNWNAGFITGWMEALYENDPHTFCSLPPQSGQGQERHTELSPLPVSVLQEA